MITNHQTYHVTWTDWSGATQTGRVAVKRETGEPPTKTRQRAIQAAGWKFGITARRVTSAVAVNPPAEPLDSVSFGQ